jgi:hypothetical protein
MEGGGGEVKKMNGVYREETGEKEPKREKQEEEKKKKAPHPAFLLAACSLLARTSSLHSSHTSRRSLSHFIRPNSSSSFSAYSHSETFETGGKGDNIFVSGKGAGKGVEE